MVIIENGKLDKMRNEIRESIIGNSNFAWIVLTKIFARVLSDELENTKIDDDLDLTVERRNDIYVVSAFIMYNLFEYDVTGLKQFVDAVGSTLEMQRFLRLPISNEVVVEYLKMSISDEDILYLLRQKS